MKHLLLFEKFMKSKILYHGSLNRFKSFKPQTSYFTDDIRFADGYADMKAMDMEIDDSVIIYTVETTGDIFDINDKNDYDKLYNALPEKVTFGHRSMGFMTATVSKDEIMEYLTGYETVQPDEKVINLNIGDEFQSPTYHLDIDVVVKKDDDDDYVMVLDKKTMMREISQLLSLRSYSDGGVFKPLKDFIKKVLNDSFGGKYIDDGSKKLLAEYLSGGSATYIEDLVVKIQNIEEIRKEYKRLYNECYPLLIDDRLGKGYGTKYVTKPTKVKLSENWTYYENKDVADTIKKLGYCGYRATERYGGTTYNTFAIFDPNKSVKIINIK
jgi:hypothetical protein